jgi:hypothetical protein
MPFKTLNAEKNETMCTNTYKTLNHRATDTTPTRKNIFFYAGALFYHFYHYQPVPEASGLELYTLEWRINVQPLAVLILAY